MSLVKSFGYAFRGFTAAVREQRNLKIHLGVALLVTALGFWFDVSAVDWCILVIMIGLVIAAELINTAFGKSRRSCNAGISSACRKSERHSRCVRFSSLDNFSYCGLYCFL